MTKDLEHKVFDWKEWLPCGLGILAYRDNVINQKPKGLYVTRPDSMIDNIQSAYQIGSILLPIAYLLSDK